MQENVKERIKSERLQPTVTVDEEFSNKDKDSVKVSDRKESSEEPFFLRESAREKEETAMTVKDV